MSINPSPTPPRGPGSLRCWRANLPPPPWEAVYAPFSGSSNTFQNSLRKNIEKMRKIFDFDHQNQPQTFSKPNQNRRPEKHQNFHWFSMDFCCLLQKPNLDFVRMAIVFLGFYTIDAFSCGMRFGSHNHAKNPSKTKSEPFKNQCQKCVVF